MKYYLVKCVGRATKDNPNFAGQISTTYHGKQQSTLQREGDHLPQENFELKHWLLADYGYTRKCDAKRSYFFKRQLDTKFWTYENSIVELEI